MRKLNVHRVKQYRRDHGCSLQSSVTNLKKIDRIENIKSMIDAKEKGDIDLIIDLMFNHIKALEDLT